MSGLLLIAAMAAEERALKAGAPRASIVRTGIGPVMSAQDVAPALERGVRALKEGGVCVIDFHVDPGEERQSGASVGQRKTG